MASESESESESVAYIAAATNRFNHAADASSSSLIALGSGRLIACWDAKDENDRGVFATLPGHDGLVTCIRFLGDNILLSADDKGILRSWRRSTGNLKWVSTGVIQAHVQPVSVLCVFEQVVVTGASDSLVKIWSFESVQQIGTTNETFKEVQTISLQSKFPLAVALSTLPQSKAIVLAISGTDRSVQIWTRSDDVFVRSAVLTGHEDWVRTLAFRSPVIDSDPLVLASGSQDATIRLWNIEPLVKDTLVTPANAEGPLSDDLLDAFEASLRDVADAEEGGRQISLKRHILAVKSEQGNLQRFSVTFDALLIGHEAGVTSLSWRPSSSPSSLPTLLSTSTDSSLILWSPSDVVTSQEGSSAIWINRQRFGDLGGQRLGGFVGGLWARLGGEALTWGWSGGWRRWRCDQQGISETWTEVGAIGGHNGPVKGLDWSPNGEYLISAGVDQTTRVHGPIPVSGVSGLATESWHELGRPQVHGYDLLDVAFLDPLKFVSIADEKVARVFEAPRGFTSVLKGLGVSHVTVDESERPLTANVPPLGLSNKAVTEAQSQATGNNASASSPSTRRPFEGELASMTLWPETEKVFGHGYESISLSASKSRRLIATACKATTPEHAVVRVYDTAKWQLLGKPLEGHSLTITRIAFSPDDRFIVSVSRDRSWRLFQSQENDGYTSIAADKSHTRIIWDCAWAHECDVFATASRDKTVKIWNVRDQADVSRWTAICTIKLKEAATAVAFDAQDTRGRRHLAIGLETGDILIYSNVATLLADWRLEQSMGSSIAHVSHIYRLAWRPMIDQTSVRQLATCSEDGTVKVLIVHIETDETTILDG